MRLRQTSIKRHRIYTWQKEARVKRVKRDKEIHLLNVLWLAKRDNTRIEKNLCL